VIEDVVAQAGKGFFRGIGFLIAELLFWRLCYIVGWPVCKILTLGQYPRRVERERAIFRQEKAHTGFTCAASGLIILLVLAVIYSGYWPSSFPGFTSE